MLTSILFMSMLWPSALSEYCQTKDDSAIMGVAFDAKSSHFLYCERHTINWQDNSATVEYLDRDQKVFAQKRIFYVEELELPNISQNDFRQGEYRSISRDSDSLVMSYKKNEKARLKSKRVKLGSVDIVDAGFDHFVRANWQSLISGKSFAAHFASALHLQNINLRISAQSLKSCPQLANDEQYFCFWVDINNAFLRMFTSRLKLVYDTNQRLRLFEGVVNILSKNNKSQTARIEYFYNEALLKQGG